MNFNGMDGKTIKGKLKLEFESTESEDIGNYLNTRAKEGESYLIRKENCVCSFYRFDGDVNDS